MTPVRLAVNFALAAVLPGLLLCGALRCPRSLPERAVFVVPLSMSALAISAAALGTLGVGLTTAWVIALDVALAGGWLARGRLRRGAGRRNGVRARRWGDGRRLMTLAIPGALLLAAYIAASGGLGPLPADDGLIHSRVVRWFLDGRSAPPVLPDHLSASAYVEIRYGWHVLAATLVRGTDIDAGRAASLAAWVVVVHLPAALAIFSRRLGLGWTISGTAAFASLGFGLVPFRPGALGQAPLLAGAYLLAPLASVALFEALRRRRPAALALAVVLTAGLLYVHPSDLLTEALLLAVLAGASWRLIPFLRIPDARGLALGAAALGIAALPELHQPSGRIPGPHLGDPLPLSADLQRLLVPHHLNGLAGDVLGTAVRTTNDFALPILALVAVVLAWRRRATRALLALGTVLLLLEIDSWGWQWPEPIFRRLVPWIDPERLLYLGWFLLPPLAALGIAALARALRVRIRSAQLVLPLAGLLAAIPALSFAPGVLTHAQHRLVALTDADRQAFTTLDRIVPPDELVLTDGVSDGGAWLPILGDRDLLLGPAWRDNSAAPEVIAALRSLCASGGGALVRQLQVRWVYLGRETREGESYAERGCLPPRASLVEIELPGIIETGSQRPHLFEVAGASAQHLDRTVTDMR